MGEGVLPSIFACSRNDAIVVSLNWEEIRRFMWSYVGIVRTDKRIERALRRIENVRDELRQYYLDFKITSDLIELRNLALVAHLMIESARRRKESRGLHYTLEGADVPAQAMLSIEALHQAPYIRLVRILIAALTVAFCFIIYIVWKERAKTPAGRPA